jgi:hypothetical protein
MVNDKLMESELITIIVWTRSASDTRRQLARCPWAVTMAGLGDLFMCLPGSGPLACVFGLVPAVPACVCFFASISGNQPTDWDKQLSDCVATTCVEPVGL